MPPVRRTNSDETEYKIISSRTDSRKYN